MFRYSLGYGFNCSGSSCFYSRFLLVNNLFMIGRVCVFACACGIYRLVIYVVQELLNKNQFIFQLINYGLSICMWLVGFQVCGSLDKGFLFGEGESSCSLRGQGQGGLGGVERRDGGFFDDAVAGFDYFVGGRGSQGVRVGCCRENLDVGSQWRLVGIFISIGFSFYISICIFLERLLVRGFRSQLAWFLEELGIGLEF